MQRIHKHLVPSTPSKTRIRFPAGAKILSAGMQRGRVALWALSDPFTDEGETRTVHVFHTGDDVPKHLNETHHVATLLLDAGEYILHVFVE